jgi:hypothetical protein
LSDHGPCAYDLRALRHEQGEESTVDVERKLHNRRGKKMVKVTFAKSQLAAMQGTGNSLLLTFYWEIPTLNYSAL